MRLVFRWGAAVAVSAAGFVLAWWVCQEQVGLDEGASLGIAGAVLAVVTAVAGWWAARGADGQGSGRRLVQKARAGRDANMAGRDQIIADQVVIAGASPAEPVVPGLLPRDVTGFTGREDELAQLARLAGGGQVLVSAIGGTAGVGKTALAVHAAHRLLGQFPDGHLFADLRGYTDGQDPAVPDEVLEVFLRRLGIPAEDVPVTTEERSGLLRQMLASRCVLMVLDNARSEGQVRPLLPGAGGSLVLVTSRSTLPGLEADARIDLDVLSGDEAVAMLTGLVGLDRAKAEPQAVEELVRLCGRLPLALRIAGQVLATHRAWPVARMTQLLTNERNRLERLDAGDLRVRAAFGVSYGLLQQGDARPFRLLGLHPGPGFDVAATAALAGIEDEEAESVLSRLAEAHLVTEEEAAGQYGMHDLLRLFARNTCQDTDDQADQEAAEGRLVGYYANLAAFLDSCVDPNQRPAAVRAAEQARKPLPSMPQALVVFQAERLNLLAAVGLAAQRGWDEQVRRLSESMGDSLRILHYLDDLLTLMEAALAATRHAGNADAEGRALGNLGVAYQELRRSEDALAYLQQAQAIFRERDDRSSEGVVIVTLGTAYRKMGRFEDAIACFRQALAIFRETGDRRTEGQALNNLGVVYETMGRDEDAIACFQQDIAICRETGDRHGEGQTLSNLGGVYQDLRRSKDAITSLQQALAHTSGRPATGTQRARPWTNSALSTARWGSPTEQLYAGARRLRSCVMSANTRKPCAWPTWPPTPKPGDAAAGGAQVGYKRPRRDSLPCSSQ